MKKIYKIIVVAVVVLLIASCVIAVGDPPHKDPPGKKKPKPEPDPEVTIFWHRIQFGGVIGISASADPEEPVIRNVSWSRITIKGSVTVVDSDEGGWSDWSSWWVIHRGSEDPEPNPSAEIDLKIGWNLISIPLDYVVYINDSYILFDNITYSWIEACDNRMVMIFLYSWDADNQMYALSDKFEPGMGYWIYSFEDCTMVVSCQKC